MKLTKGNMKKLIEENFPGLRMDTFLITLDDGEYNARSKFEGVNASVRTGTEGWEDRVVTHIKWQLNL